LPISDRDRYRQTYRQTDRHTVVAAVVVVVDTAMYSVRLLTVIALFNSHIKIYKDWPLSW